jgi:S-adenosyl methyltransferase
MGSASISRRAREEIAGFFDGLDLVGPGLVHLSEWRPVSAPETGCRPTPESPESRDAGRAGTTRPVRATGHETGFAAGPEQPGASVPPVPTTLSAATGRRRPGGRRARRSFPLTLAAAAGMLLTLSGCHSDQNVSRAYECSKDKEYQQSSTACHSSPSSRAPGVARVQVSPPG